MQPIIREVIAKDQNKGEALIGDAVTYYQRGSKFQSADEAFANLLKHINPLMPPGLRRQALEAAVKSLTTDSGKDDHLQWRIQVYTEKGVADFHSEKAALLFEILPMIRELDPDWAKKLVEQHDDLAQADAGRGKILNAQGGVVIKDTDNPASPAEMASKEQSVMEWSRLDQIQAIAAKDPNQALTLAMSISDPGRRAMGMAYAASGFGDHPDQALAMLNDSQKSLASIKKDGEKLETYAAIAESASALYDTAVALDCVDKGIDLGEQAYEESRKEHPERHGYEWDGQDAMQKLVEIGMTINPHEIVGRVEAIRDPVLQGYMLVAAAREIDAGKAGGWMKAFQG